MAGGYRDLPMNRREMLRMGYTHLSSKPCRECSAVIELWKTSKGKFVAFDMPTITGDREERTVIHGDTCTKSKPAPARQLPPSTRSRENAVHQLRSSSNARVVVALYDDGAAVSVRQGIPGADLRHELITEANILQRALEAQNANR